MKSVKPCMKRCIALAVELDDMGKGLIDWKEIEA